MISNELRAALEAIAAGGRAADLESETLDFKRQPPHMADAYRIAADASVCFANHLGGEIVFGVDDHRAGPRAFLGTTLDISDLRRRLFELTEPPVAVDLEEHEVEGRRLVVIRVLETNYVHADRKGRATQRHGTSCVSLGPDQVARLREERAGLDWSREPCSWARTADVRDRALHIVRERLARYDDARRQLAHAATRDMLAGLALTDARGRLRNAGAVLLCAPPPEITSTWIVFVSRRTPGSEPVAHVRAGGSLLEAFTEVEGLLAARAQSVPLLIGGGQQLELNDFPELTIREALANAVLHRDYRVRGPVMVDHSPQVLVISSPGPLVHGVSTQNILRHPPQPRSPALAAAGHQLGLAEEVGAGVDRMFRAMLRTGKEAPTIESSASNVRVSLVGGAPDLQVARFVVTLPAEEQEDVDTMLVLHYLRTRRVVRAADLTLVLQRPAQEVQAILARLAADDVGLLEPTRETARLREPTYRLRIEVLHKLGSAVGYSRRTAAEIEKEVIKLVSDQGSVRNEMVRALFDVKVERASAILRELVERGVLVRTSRAARGPNVEYGPGPAFGVERADSELSRA
jgi:ATP-dependent DNA helicase RecG